MGSNHIGRQIGHCQYYKARDSNPFQHSNQLAMTSEHQFEIRHTRRNFYRSPKIFVKDLFVGRNFFFDRNEKKFAMPIFCKMQFLRKLKFAHPGANWSRCRSRCICAEKKVSENRFLQKSDTKSGLSGSSIVHPSPPPSKKSAQDRFCNWWK